MFPTSSTANPARVRSGVPTGGRFAAAAHAESEVRLTVTSPADEPALNEIAATDGGADSPDQRCPECGRYTSPGTDHICFAHSALASRLDEVRHRVEVANRKLARQGIAERFTVEVLGRRSESRTDQGGITATREMVDYRLNRPPLKLGEWSFAGRVDTVADGTPIVMSTPDVQLHGYRPDAQQCDHCGTNRNRNATYLLCDGEGRVKQVGSGCLEAFTGITPRGLWSLEWNADTGDDDDSDGFGSGGWEQSATPDAVLRVALAVTDNGRSYLSRARAEESGQDASSSAVQSFLFPTPDTVASPEYQDLKGLADSPETAALAQEVLEFARTMDGDDDYPSNMRVLAAQEQLSGKHIALVASAVSGWHRERERQVKAAAEAAAPHLDEWIGQPGDKITAVPATITAVRYLDEAYGTTTLLAMRDDAGHSLKWFASGHKDFTDGARVVLDRATVKAHDVYQGSKQTVLTRAKISSLDTATAGQ